MTELIFVLECYQNNKLKLQPCVCYTIDNECTLKLNSSLWLPQKKMVDKTAVMSDTTIKC